MFIKNLISFGKTWLLCKSRYLYQKNYDTTLAQSIKLETNTNKVKHQPEHLFEDYLKRLESFLMLFVMSYCGFPPHPTPPNFCVNL